jgi:hypothetical protein
MNMEFMQWFDWITPTSPLISFFFGVLFTIILGTTIWFETKQPKIVLIASAGIGWPVDSELDAIAECRLTL